jgi:predicted DNA-binding protein
MISFRLAQPQHDRVTALAGDRAATVSELIRDLIDRELERAEPRLPTGG